MTNHWIDFRNADVIMINGCNPAENHPVAWHWIRTAMDRGAKLINIDPRFTRTSSQADVYARIRPGTNVAFAGGLIDHILQNDRYQKPYVVAYTNAPMIVDDRYGFTDGLFSGYDAATRSYANATWQYKRSADGTPQRDDTLADPRTVFQIMKRHYARYTPEMVERITGIPKAKAVEIYELFSATGRPDRAGTVLYAMGQTQATIGTQNIRALAITQLLLGNIGIAGGGVNALRGEANVQGATDMALLWQDVPGYMGIPRQAAHPTLKDYLAKETPATGYWANKPNFFVSLLKAWWGDAATAANDFGYDWLPKAKGNYSVLEIFDSMWNGKIKGFTVIGENPAVGSPNQNKVREAMEKLDWLVVADQWLTETAEFWSAKRPLRDTAETADPTKIGTEVFFLPVASFNERAGSYTNSGRWIQWMEKAVEPEGDSRSDLWIVDRLYKELRKAYAGSTAAKDQQFLEAVGKIPAETARQTDTLTLINHQLAAAADTDVQLAESFVKFKDTLERLNHNTVSNTQGIVQMSKTFAASDRYHAVICLGAVIRGETPHFEYVAGEAARGIADAARDTGVPVIFGVITPNTLEQALERAGGKVGNKGYDAAVNAIEMASLLRQLRPD